MIQQQAQSTRPELDRAIAALQEHTDAWARLAPGKKIRFLLDARACAAEEAADWVAAACRAKGLPEDAPPAGEEWLSGPWALLFMLNRLIETMRAVARGGSPPLRPGSVRTRPDGQVAVKVFPAGLYDRLLIGGVSAEVWMQRGVTPENLTEQMAAFYRQPAPRGAVCLVLGAGNIAAIPPLDLLYKLYAEGQVCLLKMNPVNEYLGPFFERIFARLIAAGFLHVAYGGAEIGAYLTGHEGIERIHITGSAQTHDTIVFGQGPAGAARKAARRPLTEKPISSELGNVSPTIVLPGPWSAADRRFQAEHIATQKLHNGGFNCIAAQVLVLPQDWAQTPALLEALREVLRRAPPRPAYYPGAAARRDALAVQHPQAESLDGAGNGATPRMLIAVPSAAAEDTCFTTEAFAGVLATTTLPGDAAAFLRHAVIFCNETLAGTLGANLIVHPATARQLGPLLDTAIADLRYGCVAVNAWTGVGFLLAQASWGAFPGHTLEDVGSGIGVVHNSLFFARPEKSVVYGPFYPFPRGLLHGQLHTLPRPPWFVTNRQAHRIGRRLARFEAHPSIRHLPGIFFDALRG